MEKFQRGIVTSLEEMRGRIANGVLIALALIALPALAGSLMRIQSIGWQPVMGFHIAAAGVLIGAALARRRLSFKVRGSSIVGIIFLVGIGGFLNFALSGAGYPALLVSAIVAAVLFGTRGGLIVLFLGLMATIVIGLAYANHLLPLRFDANLYTVQFQSWLTALLGLALFGGGGVATVVGLNSALIRAIDSHVARHDDLKKLVEERALELRDEIKEREKAENHLRLNEEKYHRLIDAQTELITTFTPDGTFTFVSESYCQFVGKTKEDLLGRSLFNAVPEEEIPALKDYFASFSSERQHQTTENPVESEDGELRYFEWSNSALLDENGDVEEIQSVGRDITERKEVERLKSEFISLVSHELRTPLTSIMGSISLIKGGALGDIPEKMSDMLGIAKGNSERLIGIVNDILDFEKLQSGGMEFNFVEVDLVELVRHTIDLNQSYAEQCGVQFDLIKADTGICVRGDRERLEQVMTNLLSNAAKFSTKGTSIEISVFDRDGIARVDVADTGPGIPEEFKDRIFDRFSQADTGDKRTVKGTGLGLSISRAIIERHEGSIDFDSRTGQGTTFHFELPIVIPAEMAII